MDEDDIDAMVREVADSIRRGPYDVALRGVHDMLTIPMQMEAELTAANARIAELEHEKADTVLRMTTWAANTLHTCHEQCERPLCVANRRIAALESLLGEAPHSELCDSMASGWVAGLEVAPGDLDCNCFKSRVALEGVRHERLS